MINRVERYVQIGTQLTISLVKANKDKAIRLCEESKEIKSQMSLEELKSLEGRISRREFHEGIMPLIRQKLQATQVI